MGCLFRSSLSSRDLMLVLPFLPRTWTTENLEPLPQKKTWKSKDFVDSYVIGHVPEVGALPPLPCRGNRLLGLFERAWSLRGLELGLMMHTGEE